MNNCSNDRLNWGEAMVRPAEYTRHAIIKAAVDLFAEKGFEGASVRDIITKARVNQAAINYHFKCKALRRIAGRKSSSRSSEAPFVAGNRLASK